MQQPADQPYWNPSQYNQPTQAWNAGPSPYPQQPPILPGAPRSPRQPDQPGGLRQFFKSKLGIGCLVAVLLFSCGTRGLVTAVSGSKTATTTTPTAISAKSSPSEPPPPPTPAQAALVATQEPSLTPTPTPNPTPWSTSTPTLMPNPTSWPTSMPTPMPNPTPWPTSMPTPTNTGTTMSAPSGYSKLIFNDTFSGITLDSTKWIPQIADQGGIWNNNGQLPYPLSAIGNAGNYDAEYDSPAALTVNNGLTITAKPDTSQSGYTWQSGVIDTHGKFYFQGGYLQVRAKMPDSRTGGWGAIWSLEGGCEIDTQESGFTALGTNVVNQVMASHMPDCNSNGQFYNSNVDLSGGYHIYGMQYVPGKSVTMYLDGKQVAQFTTNIPTGSMSIILSLEVANSSASDWHTVVSNQTPIPLTMNVSEVQVWQ